MKRKPIWFVAGCLAMGSLSGNLIAADVPVDSKKPALNDRTDKASAVQPLRANDLIGKTVKNEEGKDIGSIKDIVVDSRQGRVAYAVLQFGGFLGLGEKQFAIPFGALREDAARQNLILNVKKEKLEAARGFESDKWPDMADETWARDTHKHYGYDTYWEDRDTTKPRLDDQKNPQNTPSTQPNKDPKLTVLPQFDRENFWVNRVSQIIGKPVKNTANEDLGKVADIMIDMKHGRLVYAILTDGGTLGIDETLTAVPFSALQSQAEKKQFTLASNKDSLKAYSFKESAWPNMSDMHWARQIHQGFKQEPYWNVYGTPGDDLDTNWHHGSDYNKAFDANKSRTLTGKVSSISEYSPAKDSAKGRTIVIKNDAGESFTVHLGPISYLDRKDEALMLKEGDTVTVTVSTGKFEGRETYQARDIRTANGQTYKLRDDQGRPRWDSSDDNRNQGNQNNTNNENRPDQNKQDPNKQNPNRQ